MQQQDQIGARRLVRDGAASVATLDELERIYNGPIPEPARSIAKLGSPAALLLVRATAEAAFFAAMARGQLRTIRQRRRDGTCYPALFDDLALYRRQRLAWRRLAATIAQREAPPISGRGF